MTNLLLVAMVVVFGSCATVFPSKCQPGAQSRDPDHRVWGVNDCYQCDDGAPGRVNDAGHYVCRVQPGATYPTCNECDAPIVNFGAPRPVDGGMPASGKPLEQRVQ